MGNISSTTEKKISRILCLFFLANEMNPAEGDVMGPTAVFQVMLLLKDKKMQHI